MRRRPARRALAVGIMALGLATASCGDRSSDGGDDQVIAGLVRQPAPDLSRIFLPDASRGDEALAMVAPDGEILVVYFGYTACPDICPTTMSDLRTALGELDDGYRSRVEVAMATIDPNRDTGNILTSYVQTFVPDAHTLRTDDNTLLRVATDAFGADYEITTSAAGEPEVAHTTWLYAIDDQGRLRVQWAFGTTSEDIANDLQILLEADSTDAIET